VSGFYKGSGHILTANRNYSCTTQITENFGLFCRKNARLYALVEDYFYDRSGDYLDDDCAITEDNFNNETQERFDENEHINSDERY